MEASASSVGQVLRIAGMKVSSVEKVNVGLYYYVLALVSNGVGEFPLLLYDVPAVEVLARTRTSVVTNVLTRQVRTNMNHKDHILEHFVYRTTAALLCEV